MRVEELPRPARLIAVATRDAVTAARTGDPTAFAEACEELAGCEPASVRLVLGDVVRQLLETTHPDGFDADDLRAAIASCLRFAVPSGADVDPGALVVLVTGALGVYDPEAEPPVLPPAVVGRHAALLIGSLLTDLRAELDPYLAVAFAERERAETVEQP